MPNESAPLLDCTDPRSGIVRCCVFDDPTGLDFHLAAEIRLVGEDVYSVFGRNMTTGEAFHFTALHDGWDFALSSWESMIERWETVLGL